MGIYAGAENSSDAALFITEYMEEEFHKKYASRMFLYKGISEYAETKKFPEEFEQLVAMQTRYAAYDQCPVWDFVDIYTVLESKYFGGEMTAEQLAKELQKAMEQRIMG